MLCREFKCTPRQLEEDFYPDEVADFSQLLEYVGKVEAAERKRMEAANRR